jgi:integrase/recombinase XerD
LTFFCCANDVGIRVLEATRPHIELYRDTLEERELAASTIDRRFSTVCGFYRWRVTSNPALYVRPPAVHPSEGYGKDRGELGAFLFTSERFDRAHATLGALLGLNGLRVSEACATNIDDLGSERGHGTLRILGRETNRQ